MTSRTESDLRRGLRDLADQPGPPNLAELALTAARRWRRWRIGLTAAGVAAVGAVTIPLAVKAIGPDSPAHRPGSSGTTCQTATDEAVPENGVPSAHWPAFLDPIVAKLPPRDDYSLQSGYGMCAEGGTDGAPGPTAYAVINLGPNRAHGHLTVDLYLDHEHSSVTCATLPTTAELVFCADSEPGAPLVFAVNPDSTGLIVTAVYPDTRTVSIGAWETPLTAEDLRAAVADPAVADLFP